MADHPVPKPWISDIQPYIAGKSAGADGRPLVKLSANENPWGCSSAALAVREHLAPPALYPDPDSIVLRRALGALHSIDPAQILCGTGSGELLMVAASAFAGPGDEVLYVRYGFSLYDIAARRCGATPVVVPDHDYGTDVGAVIAHVTPRTRVIFIANPNNPTGSFLPRSEVARLHAALPGDVLLVLDQAYAEYVAPQDDDGGLALAAAHGNVLVTRTFSKAYGLAGERVGWATGAPPLIEIMNRLRGPFNLGTAAQATAAAALGDQGFVAYAFSANAEGRARFVAAIEAMGNHGLRAIPSQANFVLVLFTGHLTAEAAYLGLAAAGTITRWLPGQGLPHGLRITIGTPQQMDDVIAALHRLTRQAR